MKKYRKFIVLILFSLLILSSFGFSTVEDEKAQIDNYAKATKDSLEQAKKEFDRVLELWEKYIINEYQNLPKKYHSVINEINNKVKPKIKTTGRYLGGFLSFVTNFLNSEEKAEKFVTEAKKYLPDKSDPYNALNVMLAAMEEIDRRTSVNKKDFFKNPVVSSLKIMINSFNRYLYEAAKNCKKGIVKAQELIKKRGGRCFGGKGGEELAGTPMERAWAKLTKGSEQLCPTGLRTSSLEEVWQSQQDNEPWIWFRNKWVKLGQSLSDVQNIFNYYRYAYGKKINSTELTNWLVNKHRRFKQLESAAVERFNVLTFRGLGTDSKFCRESILSDAGYSDKRSSILSECENNLEQFKGKYIFSNPSNIRSDSNKIFDILTNTYRFSGVVKDKETDNKVEGAKVEITMGGITKSAKTNDRGYFELKINKKVVSSRSIQIKITRKGYKDTVENTVISKQCANLGVLTISKGKEIESLIISPSSKTIKIGETVSFSVSAKYKDGTVEGLPPGLVTFSGADKGVFTGKTVGTFTVTASYDQFGTSATVTVEEEKKDEDVDEAIKDVKDEDEDKEEDEIDQCSKEYIKGVISSIKDIILELSTTYSLFSTYNLKFNQELNIQKTKVCKNGIVAYSYAQARGLVNKLYTLKDSLKSKLTALILLSAMCPSDPKNNRPDLKDIISLIAGKGGYAELANKSLAAMTGRLKNEFNCDENEVINRGEKIVPPGLDPDFLQNGGNMTEVEGDGVDNDGNGLQDDSQIELAGYNVTLVLYDSGRLKDDMFTLSVSGFGTLGTTPRGGLQAFGLNLSPGTYTATVTCIFAPDNVGTYTLNVIYKGRVIGCISGAPPQGGGGSVSFTVPNE